MEEWTQANKDAELLEAARYGESVEVNEVLAMGANVNFQDATGNTALHRACANNHVEVCASWNVLFVYVSMW